jgi:SAM-dependent methyltransferase
LTSAFLDMQARVGITVHVGGAAERRELLSLCHVAPGREVLDVGCGVGVGVVDLARTHGCRVVGIDATASMIDWARRRTRGAAVDDRVELHVADVLDLPFAADRFDVVVCESVLAFVADKDRAISEMVRVAKPGGFVGLSELFLLGGRRSPRVDALAGLQGTEIVTLDAWWGIWERSGLEDRVVRPYRVDLAREVRNRLRWVGPRLLVLALVRTVRLWIAAPSLRPQLRLMFGRAPSVPGEGRGGPSLFGSFGYGLFVGRKP